MIKCTMKRMATPVVKSASIRDTNVIFCSMNHGYNQ